MAADDRFELLAPHPLALVTFAVRAGDDAGRRLLAAVNASGQAYLTHTLVNGRFAIRMAIGSVLTERRHVRGRLAGDQRSAARQLRRAEFTWVGRR